MDAIRVSIGTEPSQHIACEVLKSSIIRRTSRPVEFTQSWTAAGWHPLMTAAPRVKQGTKFSAWRWIVPQVYDFGGVAIYLDADQVVLADIGELWDIGGRFSALTLQFIACVTNAVGVFGKNKVPEPGKCQTSVMVMDCAMCKWDAHAAFEKVARGEAKYAELMQGGLFPRGCVIDLDPAWNHFSLETPETKLLHFSHVSSQPWHKPDANPGTERWRAELRASIDAGHVSRADLKAEIKRGHVHKVFKDCL